MLQLAVDGETDVLAGDRRLSHVSCVSSLLHVNLQMCKTRSSRQFLLKLQFDTGGAFPFRVHGADYMRCELSVRITAKAALANFNPVQLHRSDRFRLFVCSVRIDHKVTAMVL